MFEPQNPAWIEPSLFSYCLQQVVVQFNDLLTCWKNPGVSKYPENWGIFQAYEILV